MQTGMVSTWQGNILEIGPMYPFVGTEMLMVVIGFVFWIGWHIVQIKQENEEIEHIKKLAQDKGVQDRIISRKNTGNR